MTITSLNEMLVKAIKYSAKYTLMMIAARKLLLEGIDSEKLERHIKTNNLSETKDYLAYYILSSMKEIESDKSLIEDISLIKLAESLHLKHGDRCSDVDKDLAEKARTIEVLSKQLAHVNSLPPLNYAALSSKITQRLAVLAKTDQKAAKELLDLFDETKRYIAK